MKHRIDAGFIGGLVTALPALWAIAALFHWKPLPMDGSTDEWWHVPWLFTVIFAAPAVIIGCGILASLWIWDRRSQNGGGKDV